MRALIRAAEKAMEEAQEEIPEEAPEEIRRRSRRGPVGCEPPASSSDRRTGAGSGAADGTARAE
jgi:hypothetical protein